MFTVRLENIKIRQDLSNDEVSKIAYTKFNIPQESVSDYKIVKKSIDARDKNDIFYNYSIVVFLKENFKVSKLMKNKNASLIEQEQKQKTVLHNDLKAYNRPVIIGAGPAGLFCALTLIENGVKPIIVEQGKTVEERQKDVELFLKERMLNTCSNVQFGEGGIVHLPEKSLGGSVHLLQVEAGRGVPAHPLEEWGVLVGNKVFVGARGGIEAGMCIVGDADQVVGHYVAAAEPIESVQETSLVGDLFVMVEVGIHRAGMDPGIRTPRTGHRRRLTQQRAQRLFEPLLHTLIMGLNLPPMITHAVVG